MASLPWLNPFCICFAIVNPMGGKFAAQHIEAQIQSLSFKPLEALGEALRDFTSVTDETIRCREDLIA